MGCYPSVYPQSKKLEKKTPTLVFSSFHPFIGLRIPSWTELLANREFHLANIGCSPATALSMTEKKRNLYLWCINSDGAA